jgi:GH24 family phage-related lysozyme (muramidase)
LKQLYAEPKRQRASSKVTTVKPMPEGLSDTVNKSLLSLAQNCGIKRCLTLMTQVINNSRSS